MQELAVSPEPEPERSDVREKALDRSGLR